MADMKPNVCQFWSVTASGASCILPTLSGIINRKTGLAWTRTVAGVIDTSAITGYNEGACDGYGTQITCDAYSPYHLQFGPLAPDTTATGAEITKLVSSRLPFNCEVVNRRAVLSPCYFWTANPTMFSVDASGTINPIDFQCSQATVDEVVTKYNDLKIDISTGYVALPCNGAKAECPHYTGVCWEYCVDSKMRQGDKLLADQILELRWHIKKESWNALEYYKTFKDPVINAWAGEIFVVSGTGTEKVQTQIKSTSVSISDFETFTVARSTVPLTQGLNADDYNKNYPTLVEQLKILPLSPIVRNKFDEINNVNVFETSDFDHKYVLLVGDTFTSNTDVIALNLSDPELDFLSSNLKQFDSMYAMKASMGAEAFDKFYSDFSNNLSLVRMMMPEKVFASELPSFGYMFYIPVETFWGMNKLAVLAKVDGIWQYDTIDLLKLFIGGVVGQTSFEIEGDGGTVSYLPSYDNDFGAYTNSNGKITFQFFPLINKFAQPSVAYSYIDGIRERLPANPANLGDALTYEFSYKLYRTLLGSDITVEFENMRFFGNAGYGFISLPDENNSLSTIVKPWEIDGSIFMVFPDGSLCEMEVHEKCTDRLPVNCMIIKPKNINDFKAVCKDAYLSISKIYFYERRTFTPSGEEAEEVREDFLEEDAVVDYRTTLSLKATGNVFELTKFGYESLMPTIVFKGPSGRIIGQAKTKLITWIRQPFCRDVEIMYRWRAMYTNSKLLPEFDCWQKAGVVVSKELESRGYTPMCGDHDLSFFANTGPMWYPYVDCEEIAFYRLLGINDYDIGPMEIFTDPQFDDEGNEVVHGSHDMRMLGPANHFAVTGESHASIWNCTCDWTLYNLDKVGDNIFSGYAFYRGGLDDVAKIKALSMNGSLPKFGNVYRDFLRSYRSMDNVDYYYWNGSQYTRRRKWVPMYEFYSPTFCEDLNDYPYRLGSYSDYTEDKSIFTHPFGCFLADSIEDVPINEQLLSDVDEGVNRFRGEDIFRTHYTLAGLAYPRPKNPAQYLVGGNLVDIMPWYTYHDAPDSPSKSIQWAWREYWKDIVRESVEIKSSFSLDYLKGHPVASTLPSEDILPPYDESAKGRHLFLNIDYPDYLYDGMLKEHKLVCDEGSHIITIIPPDTDDEGEEINPNIWQVKLNEGPTRCMNVATGEWVTASGEVGPGGDEGSKCNVDLYDVCTKSPWVEDVTLFDTGYNSKTPDPDRTITDYSEIPPINTYYQRGLNVSLNSANLGLLPRKLIDADSPEMRLSAVSEYTSEDNPWKASDPDHFFPLSSDVNLEYGITDGTVTATFHFPEPISIAAIAVSYKYGSLLQEFTPSNVSTVQSGTSWHIPGIKIFRSEDDATYTSLYDLDAVGMATKKEGIREALCFYDFHYSNESVKPSNYVKIVWRFEPNSEEYAQIASEASGSHDIINHRFLLNYIHIYDSEFVEATETISTYERMYNVSYGGHGDFPPHGYDSTGSLLYVLPNDNSTVYQMDSRYGVVGMPGSSNDCKSMNKVRGRIMKACHADKERVEGSDLTTWEAEQKKIHDEIAVKSGNTSITLKSVPPPNMTYLLNKVGVTFPSWSCTLTNTVVAPLTEVTQYNPYSPGGHVFIRLYKDMIKSICGRIFVRIWVDWADWGFKRYASEDVTALDWVVVAYFRGTGRYLIAPMLYIQEQMTRLEQIAEGLKSANVNPSKYTYPAPVDPVH